ncbi:MAG: shikimate dehydrogenase [Bacteroidetes bacterium]|nr:shikimate dehydrogenase [Bacteroidota bacterium]
MRLGLIGHPVSHSWSPRLFDHLSERDGIPVRYDLFPLPDVSVLRSFLRENPDLIGLNVTIPHKTSVLSLCDDLHPSAERIGAANTLLIQRKGSNQDDVHITGYNTDVGGFTTALSQHYPVVVSVTQMQTDLVRESSANLGEIMIRHRALILGTGGSARAVAWALKNLGIPFDLAGRAPIDTVGGRVLARELGDSRSSPSSGVVFASAQRCTFDSLNPEHIQRYDLLVHCTPLGMEPGFAGRRIPIDLRHCRPSTLLFDLVYTPETTPLMQHALDCGLRVCGGIGMLKQQAEEAWALWKSAVVK